MNIKKYKPIIVVISVGIVLGIGYVVKEYVFKEALVTKEPLKKSEKRKKSAKELISRQLGMPEEKIPVRVFKVSKVDYKDDLPVVGTIKSIPEIELKFQRNGIVRKFSYDEGDKIKKGNIIAILDQEDARLEVEWAEAKILTAKAEANTFRKRLQVMKELYDTGALIKAKVEEVEAQLEAAECKIKQAEVELKSAKAKLDKTYLYAPRDGILGKKEIEEGEFVTTNDKVASLLDPDNLYAEIGIIEKDISKVRRGLQAEIVVDSYMQQKTSFWGTVERIFPNIEAKSRTLTVRIKIRSRKTKELLLPGMFARVKIFIYSKDNAIVVPDTSVDLRSRPPQVSFIEDGKVVNRKVSIDWVGTGYIVIRSGVKVGDLVIVETPGLKRLEPGTPVEIIETQESVYE